MYSPKTYEVVISKKEDLTLTEEFIRVTTVGTNLCFDDAVDLREKWNNKGYCAIMREEYPQR